jgi:hypothetical protein
MRLKIAVSVVQFRPWAPPLLYFVSGEQARDEGVKSAQARKKSRQID